MDTWFLDKKKHHTHIYLKNKKGKLRGMPFHGKRGKKLQKIVSASRPKIPQNFHIPAQCKNTKFRALRSSSS